jgi:two-component system nitrogen regulation sensor histidine kinase GlnL
MEMFSDRPLEPRAVNIHSVLDHVRRVAQSGFAAHLRVVEEYDPSLPAVWGDRDQLIQILLNLVKNAAEALSEPGRRWGRAEIRLATAYHHGVRIAVPGSERAHAPAADR